ncbi:Endoplasmic reticulum vesicle protein 25 [Vanrija pseudolonga]|uniref:Endoplasmic reticulum vesicle protein 25 n=1 Tax=Vanrija pseudolonga TaxID=143232 RepID=A0AAF0YCI9_9TREE|nr:Endoplasmic reticulum vesicle protein 25 [Vanrija pseudolonga]
MLRSSSIFFVLSLAVALLWRAPLAQAIKFELGPTEPGEPVWNFAPGNTLVIVTANVPDIPGTRVDVDIVDGSQNSNVYLSKKNIAGETRMAITTHESADVGVCLTHVDLDHSDGLQSRTVDLDVDIGAEAVDYNAIANQESLGLLEVEMRKLEDVVKEIVDEMGYLQRREMRMRDTNESTNERVKWFSIGITVGIVALGAWQIFHLRSFFKRKYLID